jgi:hypothetical protein
MDRREERVRLALASWESTVEWNVNAGRMMVHPQRLRLNDFEEERCRLALREAVVLWEANNG